MMNELEIISHANATFHIFLNEILYRTPHFHKDFEICLLLEGTLKITTSDVVLTIRQNDIWIINPFEPHEYKAADGRPLLLIIQINPAFFSSYFGVINNLSFSRTAIHAKNREYGDIYERMIVIARYSFHKPPRYELKCAELLNSIFYQLMDYIPCRSVSETEKKHAMRQANLIRQITAYIDENYYHKLLLSDIADEMHLTANYLSHFFKDATGMPFQAYLAKIRCAKAAVLLRTTDLSLFDISISCGFSSSKYFTKNFSQFYGLHPNQYRQNALPNAQGAAESPLGSEDRPLTSERKQTYSESKKTIDYYYCRLHI